MDRRRALRRWGMLLVGILAATALLATVAAMPIQEGAASLATRLEGYGAWGMAGFALVFAGLAAVLVPTSPLSFAAGLVYGWPGAVLAWATMMAVASLCFLAARRLLRGRVRPLVESGRRLRLIAEIVDARGWRIVLLVRISGMVPFGVQNYAFGTTAIPFGHFLLASAFGVLPSIVVSAAAGVASHQALTDGLDALHLAALGASVLAALLLIAVTARDLRARLAVAEAGE